MNDPAHCKDSGLTKTRLAPVIAASAFTWPRFSATRITATGAISAIDAKRGFDFVPRPDLVPVFGTPVIVELSIAGEAPG